MHSRRYARKGKGVLTISRIIEFFKEGSGCTATLQLVVALIVLFGGGTWIANHTLFQRALYYSVSPSIVHANGTKFSLVVENPGRVNLTDIQISTGSLNALISEIEMLDPHESVEISAGGIGYEFVDFYMPRLSQSKKLELIISSPDQLMIDIDNIGVTSSETVGEHLTGSRLLSHPDWALISVALVSFLAGCFVVRNIWLQQKEKRLIQMYKKETSLDK